MMNNLILAQQVQSWNAIGGKTSTKALNDNLYNNNSSNIGNSSMQSSELNGNGTMSSSWLIEGHQELLKTIAINAGHCGELLENPNGVCFQQIKLLAERNLMDKTQIVEPYIQNMRQHFIKNHVSIFNSISDINSLVQAVHMICNITERYLIVFSTLENCLEIKDRLREQFLVFVQSALFYKLNIDQREYLIKGNISEIMVQYFRETFSAFSSTIESGESSQEMEDVISNFRQFCDKLRLLRANFMNSICSNSWIAFMFSAIKEKITEVSTTDFEQEILTYIQQWKEQIIYPYMEIYFCGDSSHEMFNTLKSQVDYFVFENLAKIRIGQIFDIVIDFPNSQQAITDLKDCLNHCGMHNELVKELSKGVKSRLLLASVETKNIIMAFIRIIKSLLIIDPTGISLESVSSHIKEYLREKRPDAVRCIINEMIDEQNDSALYNELLTSEPQSSLDYDSDDASENWNPKPIHPSSSKSKMEKPDIIKIFIEMYRGNKEIFVNEYRMILAESLLKNETYDTNNEAKMAELLKIRFGDKNMQNCEIMLKDISDSKFLNSGIHSRLSNRTDYIELCNSQIAEISIQADSQIPSVFMLSKNYWPQVVFNQGAPVAQQLMTDENKPTILLHPFIEQLMEEYANQYNAIKAPRKLLWEKQMGSIDFDIEIGGEELELTNIHPVAASILFYFSDRNTWTMDEIMEIMKIDDKTFQKRINNWIKRGIIIDEGNKSYRLVDSLSSAATEQGEDENMEEMATAQSQEEELRVYQDIIINMIENFDSMPLAKIHNMLAMFVIDPLPPFDKSLSELSSFLNILVKEEVLECDGGEYKIKR